MAPTGCLGGEGWTGLSGSNKGGDGGQGGNAGDITITAKNFPPSGANSKGVVIYGYDSEKVTSSTSPLMIGTMYELSDEKNNLIYRINAVGGSGGIPGGCTGNSFPGSFGAKGNNGIINAPH